MSWQVQEAKQRFSEVLRAVESEGPQTITRHGKEIAVVVDISAYRRLTGRKPDAIDVLLNGPKSDEFATIMEDIVAERQLDRPREIDLDGLIADLGDDVTDS